MFISLHFFKIESMEARERGRKDMREGGSRREGRGGEGRGEGMRTVSFTSLKKINK